MRNCGSAILLSRVALRAILQERQGHRLTPALNRISANVTECTAKPHSVRPMASMVRFTVAGGVL